MNQGSIKCFYRSAGVALISVMLLLAFLVTIIAYMLESQYLVIRQTSLQSVDEASYLENSYAESWAVASLTKQALEGKPIKESYQTDFLGEDWSKEGLDRVVNGLTYQAEIIDLQGRFNINNLESGKTGQWYSIFVKLLKHIEFEKNVGIDPNEVANAIVDWIDSDQISSGLGGAEDEVYLSEIPPRRAANQRLKSTEELLLIKGISTKIYKALLPYIAVIDKKDVKININTAEELVLKALQENDSPLISFEGREESSFESVEEIIQLPEFAGTGTSLQSIIDVKSNYFELEVITKSEKGESDKGKKTYFSGIQRKILDDKLEFMFFYRKRST